MSSDDDALRMSELCRAADVSAGTVKHYLREGLLPKPVKTSRNMAYYSSDSVERIKLIKQLQKQRFLPLKVIKDILESGQEEGVRRLRALVEIEDRILERVVSGDRARSETGKQIIKRLELPEDVLERLEELGVVSPDPDNGKRRFRALDIEIIEAVARMRDTGFSENLGFIVDDLLVYRDSLQRVVQEEVARFLGRIAGTVEPRRAVELLEGGIKPLSDLISAMHVKLLVAELQSHRKPRSEASG